MGRDIENREMELKFDSEKHRWITDETFSEKDNKNKIFIEKIFDFISERKKFIGTATERSHGARRIKLEILQSGDGSDSKNTPP